MSQDPPSGREDDNGATPEEAAAPGPTGDETQAFDRSPYDVAATPDDAGEDVGYGYGQAPDPTRTIYSRTTSTEPDAGPEDPERRRWLIPVIVVAVIVILGAVAAVLLFGGEDETPDPAPSETVTATEEPTTDEPTTEEPTTEEPTEEPTTEEPTTEEPTEEPAGGELLDSLEDSVVAGDVTFTLDDDGWVAAQDVIDDGALEAYEGLFVGGDEEVEMLASLWSGNDAADEFAASLVEAQDTDPVETDDTYSDGTGTYWAFILDDGQGRYIWTSDRGHVFQITGSTDYVSQFFSGLPL